MVHDFVFPMKYFLITLPKWFLFSWPKLCKTYSCVLRHFIHSFSKLCTGNLRMLEWQRRLHRHLCKCLMNTYFMLCPGVKMWRRQARVLHFNGCCYSRVLVFCPQLDCQLCFFCLIPLIILILPIKSSQELLDWLLGWGFFDCQEKPLLSRKHEAYLVKSELQSL